MAPPYAGIEYLDPNRLGPQWLPQVAVSSVTKLHHTASRTLLTQTFINPSTVSPIPSAQYTFPLYESCAIVAFQCYVGSRLIEGIIQEKDDASATFQAAVDRNEPASLLEQHTADVFSTSIGNVPAGETVKVEIEYIMELKHDAEVDGLRFTIPTSIAPRYGALPTGLSKHGASRAVTARNMNISVEVNMPGSIQSVESPSHTISLRLGGHSTNDPDDPPNPQHALVTLSQTTTELGKDFILLIKCASLSSPAALLEAHPTIPNSNALMVTLIPKFNLPRSTRPEVVFIIDRSGSMSSRVAPLKSSLSVFLKSLPLDVNFNICSFGSHHSFLWDRSRPYNNQTFAEAQEHCNRMQADFGGTEILPAIKSTIQRRLIGQNLEIMMLTDGEVWNSEVLFKYVEKETEKGDVRLFSLGIGRDVSHALIDGLARVGRGFSQVVSDEREGMESKVTRMLRGGLSAHIVNYRLEWEGKPSPEEVNLRSLSPVTSAIHRISLFDSHANTDSPVSFSDSPHFTIRTVIQAPYKIQPLFPFSRSTAYALVSSDAHPPSHVFLRGTTPEGNPLEVEIVVQRLPVQGETVHQLAARKILQELKDGTSYVHGAVDKERQPALLAKWVQKEGVRVGLKYGVASHWTSFVAVERKVGEGEWRWDQGVAGSPPSALDDDEDLVMEAEHVNDDDGMHSGGPPASHFGPRGEGGGTSVPFMMMVAEPPPPKPTSTRSKHADTRQIGRSTAPKSDYSESLTSDDYSFYSYQGSVPSGSSNLSPLIGNNPTGKGPEGESVNKPAKRPFWSALKKLKLGRSFPQQLPSKGYHVMYPDVISENSSAPLSTTVKRTLESSDLAGMTSGSAISKSAQAITHAVSIATSTFQQPHSRATASARVPQCSLSERDGAGSNNALSADEVWNVSSEPSNIEESDCQASDWTDVTVNTHSSWSNHRHSGRRHSSEKPATGSAVRILPRPPTMMQPTESHPDFVTRYRSKPNFHDLNAIEEAGDISRNHRHDMFNSPPLPDALGYNEFGLPYPPDERVHILNGFVKRMPTIEDMTFEENNRVGTAGHESNNVPSLPSPPSSASNHTESVSPNNSASEQGEQGESHMAVGRPRSSASLPASNSKKRKRGPATLVWDLPSSPPPPERFFTDTGAQPLSLRTKTLVDLQTFEGCFVLDSALAALLGVSLSDLEARLLSVPANPGLGPEYRKMVWATILAIKLFEMQLPGERSVWQLVVDKARAWIAGVGVENIAQFEKMAGEVLGA